jgi:S1-C subfamily serine protease
MFSMQSLSTVSRELSEVAARVDASVVGVHSRGGCSKTGLAWNSELVVTTARALERGERVEVVAAGKPLATKLVGVHLPSDLAVLRVEGELRALSWAAPESLTLAELVLAFARPSGHLRVRLGVLSALGAHWRLPGGTQFERYIESDLAPVPGASGGPLVSVAGELIGVNNGRLSRGALITLPAAGVSRIVDALVAHGRVLRAHLGVAIQAVALPKPLAENSGRASALLVVSVQAGSAAERAGLMLGDLLLELDGKPLARVGDLESALGEVALGQDLVLELVRGGDRRQLSVRAEERG